jgi:hypothetical protein
MAIRKPRIAEDDYLIDDDLILGGVMHEWVRCAAYKDGHRVSRDGTTAICGRPLVPDYGAWENFRSAYEAIFDKALPDWYIARDVHKDSKCAKCEGEDPFDLVDPMAIPQPDSEVFTIREHSFTDHEPTASDRLQQTRFRSKVAMVEREFSGVKDAQASVT